MNSRPLTSELSFTALTTTRHNTEEEALSALTRKSTISSISLFSNNKISTQEEKLQGQYQNKAYLFLH